MFCMKKKDIYGVKVDYCPVLFDQQIVRRFVSRRAIPQGFSSTHGIVHAGLPSVSSSFVLGSEVFEGSWLVKKVGLN